MTGKGKDSNQQARKKQIETKKCPIKRQEAEHGKCVICQCLKPDKSRQFHLKVFNGVYYCYFCLYKDWRAYWKHSNETDFLNLTINIQKIFYNNCLTCGVQVKQKNIVFQFVDISIKMENPICTFLCGECYKFLNQKSLKFSYTLNPFRKYLEVTNQTQSLKLKGIQLKDFIENSHYNIDALDQQLSIIFKNKIKQPIFIKQSSNRENKQKFTNSSKVKKQIIKLYDDKQQKKTIPKSSSIIDPAQTNYSCFNISQDEQPLEIKYEKKKSTYNNSSFCSNERKKTKTEFDKSVQSTDKSFYQAQVFEQKISSNNCFLPHTKFSSKNKPNHQKIHKFEGTNDNLNGKNVKDQLKSNQIKSKKKDSQTHQVKRQKIGSQDDQQFQKFMKPLNLQLHPPQLSNKILRPTLKFLESLKILPTDKIFSKRNFDKDSENQSLCNQTLTSTVLSDSYTSQTNDGIKNYQQNYKQSDGSYLGQYMKANSNRIQIKKQIKNDMTQNQLSTKKLGQNKNNTHAKETTMTTKNQDKIRMINQEYHVTFDSTRQNRKIKNNRPKSHLKIEPFDSISRRTLSKSFKASSLYKKKLSTFQLTRQSMIIKSKVQQKIGKTNPKLQQSINQKTITLRLNKQQTGKGKLTQQNVDKKISKEFSPKETSLKLLLKGSSNSLVQNLYQDKISNNKSQKFNPSKKESRLKEDKKQTTQQSIISNSQCKNNEQESFDSNPQLQVGLNQDQQLQQLLQSIYRLNLSSVSVSKQQASVDKITGQDQSQNVSFQQSQINSTPKLASEHIQLNSIYAHSNPVQHQSSQHPLLINFPETLLPILEQPQQTHKRQQNVPQLNELIHYKSIPQSSIAQSKNKISMSSFYSDVQQYVLGKLSANKFEETDIIEALELLLKPQEQQKNFGASFKPSQTELSKVTHKGKVPQLQQQKFAKSSTNQGIFNFEQQKCKKNGCKNYQHLLNLDELCDDCFFKYLLTE